MFDAQSSASPFKIHGTFDSALNFVKWMEAG